MTRAKEVAARMPDLFASAAGTELRIEPLGDGAAVLHGYAAERDRALRAALQSVVARAPWRRMITPGGQQMSVEMTNCGTVGWISDRRGYRYSSYDPLSGNAWPKMPADFRTLAQSAAAAAGFASFEPDACLVNCYAPGTRLSLHQDKDEADFDAPIVSVSLGLPAVFLFGGSRRADRPQRVPLAHGDVVVWGGPARLRYHGVLPLAEGEHRLTGRRRYNLTFRKAL